VWQHEEWFAPAESGEPHPALTLAEDLVASCHIDQHPFFEHAAHSRRALQIWVAQELIVTGPFSQLLLCLAAQIKNVHARAMVVEVAYGEHGAPGASIATAAHPWLLDQLRESMQIHPHELQPLPPTQLFLSQLQSICDVSPLAALGALGIGSEKLLIPEYTALRRSFEIGWADCRYQTFLNANIAEDSWHATLMAKAAGTLISFGGDPDHFLEGAKLSIDARMDYYATLLSHCLAPERASV
jgi:hypothetical protein